MSSSGPRSSARMLAICSSATSSQSGNAVRARSSPNVYDVQVRFVTVEDAERTRQPLVPVGPRQERAQVVDDEGRRRLETFEHSLDRRAHHARSRPRVWAQLDAVADDCQLPKVVQIVLAQAQRLGQGGQHLR